MRGAGRAPTSLERLAEPSARYLEAVDLRGAKESPGPWKGGMGTVHHSEALRQQSSGQAFP